jgi:hypothetical protein
MDASPEKFRHSSTVTHIAMGHEPTFAWKASPTRTPPPICTSAPFSKTALVLKIVGAASD